MPAASRSPIPDRAACLALMARYRMPPHIVRHSQTVCALALRLASQLNEYGFDLNLDLVRAGALLHDITKGHSLNRSLDHALTGAKLLKKLGYAQVAAVVRQHVRLSPSRPPGHISEAEVVNYADKRVLDENVTTLDQRLAYVRRRYGRTPQARARLDMFSAQAFDLEKDLFTVLPGSPDQLLGLDLAGEVGGP